MATNLWLVSRAGPQWRAMVARLVTAIRNGDEKMVESAVLALSRRSRLLAPLAMVVGAFAMLFQGIKLLFTNWRLTLVQILPAMWIWAAMLDLKVHVLHGKSFHPLYGLGSFLSSSASPPSRCRVLPECRVRLCYRRSGPAADPAGIRRGPPAQGDGVDLGIRDRSRAGICRHGDQSMGCPLVRTLIGHRGGGDDGGLRSRSPAVWWAESEPFPARQADCLGGGRGDGGCWFAHLPTSWAGCRSCFSGLQTFRFVAVILLIIAVVLQTGATERGQSHQVQRQAGRWSRPAGDR